MHDSGAHMAVRGGLYAVKPRFQRLLGGVADTLAARRTNPDSLTYAALGCAILGGAVLAVGAREPSLLWLLSPLVLARLALNALDGMVATRRGVGRAWGKVLNELGDRLSDLAFLTPLLLVPRIQQPIVIAALCSTLLVSYLGILAEAAGAARQYGGVMGKADRMLWLGLAAALSAATGRFEALQWLPWLLLLGAALTLLQRAHATHVAVSRGCRHAAI